MFADSLFLICTSVSSSDRSQHVVSNIGICSTGPHHHRARAPPEKDCIVDKGIDDPAPPGPNENIVGLAMKGIAG